MESMKSKASSEISRRSFLKGLGAVTVAAAIPASYAGGEWIDLGPGAATMRDISITYPEDGEWGVIVDAGGHSMLEVSEFIHENFSL